MCAGADQIIKSMKIACLECFSPGNSEADALATAIYLARSGLDVSIIGTDNESNSAATKVLLLDEVVNVDLLSSVPADQFFSEENLSQLQLSLKLFDYIYVTGKIFSLINEKVRSSLLSELKELRAVGAKVVFDCNHSAASWSDEGLAANTYTEILKITDISLPNFLEESVLFGDKDVGELIARHHGLGVQEIALKNGTKPNWLSTKPEKPPKEFPIENIEQPLDEGGAGNAFNAAYIATRLSGKTYCGSIKQGQILAAKVVLNSGAILPK